MKYLLSWCLSVFKYTKHIVALSAFFYVVFYFNNFSIGKISENDFLFQFIGILLGFSITIFQFIISMVERIKENHKQEVKGDDAKLRKFQAKLDVLYKELREDITFVFASLIIISVLFIPMPFLYHVEKSVRMAIFILNLYAIYDLVVVSFKVSNTTALIND